jgi:hypothetical protein
MPKKKNERQEGKGIEVRLPFDPILSTNKADIGVPGVMVEMSREEAEAMGAFEESAMSEADAWESQDVPPEEPEDVAEGEGRGSDLTTDAEASTAPPESAPAKRLVRRKTKAERTSDFIDDVLAIQEMSAQEADALRFIARVLVQATFPHSEVASHKWTRTNGTLTVSMVALGDGLPYGSYPRLIMTWITTEAVSNKHKMEQGYITQEEARRLELGHSLSGFMAELGLIPSGGRWGTIGRVRDQMRRLFSTAMHAEGELNAPGTDVRGDRLRNRLIADDAELWWDPKKPDQQVLWGSWVELSQPFFDLITERPVPVDMRVLRLLKKSPMALDIYTWATYRVSYLSQPTTIPWPSLMMQMGAGYPDTPQGQRDFRKKFLAAMKKVHMAWPALRVQVVDKGLRLHPSPPQVSGRGRLLMPKAKG